MEINTNKKILVIGDYCLDVFLHGEADSISPEAPILRTLINKTKTNAGMTGNIAAGINALGAECYAVGIIGEDQASRNLINILREKQINTEGMILQRGRVTSEFSRLVVGGKKYPQQSLIRFDKENEEEVNKESIDKIINFIEKIKNKIDAIIVADYDEVGKGIIKRELLSKLKEIAKQNNIILIGNSRKNFSNFEGFTCIIQNVYEAEQAYGKKADSIEKMSKELIKKLNLNAILVTKDKDGMELMTKEGIKNSFPAFAKKVVDVNGAGDSVVCAFTLALASGFDYSSSAKLASYAAAISISKLGVDVVTIKELKKYEKRKN